MAEFGNHEDGRSPGSPDDSGKQHGDHWPKSGAFGDSGRRNSQERPRTHHELPPEIDQLGAAFEEFSFHTKKAISKLGSLFRNKTKQWATLSTKVIAEYEKGDYLSATKSALKALTYAEREFKCEDPRVAKSFRDLTRCYLAEGSYDCARESCRSALEIDQVTAGKSSLQYSRSLTLLAEIDLAEGTPGEAIPHLERVLSIRKIRCAKEDSTHYDVTTLLGEAYVEVRKDDKAEELLLRAVTGIERLEGAQSPKLARPLVSLANLFLKKDSVETAIPLVTRAHTLLKEALGEEHLETRRTAVNLRILNKIGKGEPPVQ